MMPGIDRGTGLRLPRVRRAICVVDIIESVRLMQVQEDDVIERWRGIVTAVRTRVLVRRGGRMVKSLGDGMLIEFESVSDAVEATLEIHDLVAGFNVDRSPDRHIELRAGVHVAEVVVEEVDVFGSGVNLAARLGTLGRPRSVVLSTEAFDELPPSLALTSEDLGECWLKHFDRPVRAVLLQRASTPGASESQRLARDAVRLGRSVAVIPLTCRIGADEHVVIGDLIADGVIAQLALTPELLVLSRLSTAALRGTTMSPSDLQSLCGARYVLGGSYIVQGQSVVLTVELADTDGDSVVWSDRFACAIGALLEFPSEPIDRIAQGAHQAIQAIEAMRAATQPLPTLESASLLFGGIGLLHRASPNDFTRAREALAALAERVPRHHASHAWLAKWHCLRVIRGHATFSSPDAQQARYRIECALERQPDSALAWALRALVVSWLGKDLAEAETSLSRALACNPNEPLAWLFTTSVRSWQDRGREAAQAADRALALSHLHPLRYYFATLSAAGYLADGQFNRAIALCEESLRLNRSHTPTHRVLTIALVSADRLDEARQVASAMMGLQPGYSVRRYLDAYPGGDTSQARRYADALRDAGVPA